MMGLAWARLVHAEKPSEPAVFIDRRPSSLVVIPGPVPHPCGNPVCDTDTGSDAVHWCSDACHYAWHWRRLNDDAAAP